jgi:hypothetical protein
VDRDDIIRMAREAGGADITSHGWTSWVGTQSTDFLERFANLVAAHEREKVAKWMVERGYATGHGDTVEDLLAELSWQILDSWTEAALKGAATEREESVKKVEKLLDEVVNIVIKESAEHKLVKNLTSCFKEGITDAIRAREEK